jgi:hypothetical protein
MIKTRLRSPHVWLNPVEMGEIFPLNSLKAQIALNRDVSNFEEVKKRDWSEYVGIIGTFGTSEFSRPKTRL